MSANNQGSVLKINFEASRFRLDNSKILSFYQRHYVICAFVIKKTTTLFLRRVMV